MVQDAGPLRELMEMGFGEAQARSALATHGNIKEAALNFLLGSSQPEGRLHAVAGFGGDPEMDRAIEMSIKDANTSLHGTFEPLNPEERKRKDGVPVGLKNVGNTCYFNSLLQSYFTIPAFARTILATSPKE